MRRRLRSATSTTFRSLRTRNFRLFFTGQLVSQAGTWMQMVAIIWVVLDLTDNGLALGLVTAARFLPLLLLGAWTGAVSDRLDRHKMLLVTQASFAVLAIAFSVIVMTGRESLASMYALTLLFGVVTAFDNPVRRVMVSELVPPDDVPNAVGLNSAMMTGSRVFGPAVAGAVIAGPGVAWCFVADAVSYLAVLVALLRIDRSALHLAPRVAKAKGQVRSGIRYAWRHPGLRAGLGLMAVIGLLGYNFQITMALLAEETFEGDAGTYTLLYSMMSVGSVAGGLGVARARRIAPRNLLRASVGMAAAMLALALAPTVWLAMVAVIPVGWASIYVVSGTTAMAQLDADPAMRGRVLSLFAILFLGTKPFGAPLVGWLSDLTNPRVAIAAGALSAAVGALWVARQARQGPDDRTGSPQAAEPVAARAGANGARANATTGTTPVAAA